MKNNFCLIFFLIYSFTFSQELPPIIKYFPTTYGAANQNWMISQDQHHIIYFANNDGLLEFNGANWELYPSPNETIIRSVKVIGDKIYTGCYMEFGFWKRMADGKLKYTSLSKTIKSKIIDDEQFWNIWNFEQWVVFQSLNRIYIYDTKTSRFQIIQPKNNITKSFRTKSSIYFQSVNEGLYEIESGKGRLVSDNPILKTNRIVNVFTIDDGLLLQTQFNGFYKLVSGSLSKYVTDADAELATNSVYNSLLLSDGSFALGTVSNGVFILSKEGKIKHHVYQNKGLSNNTALSLFEDADRNLWVGLDNGINCINLQSPIGRYRDNTGTLGTVYASKLYGGRLYLGTNQGLFCKKYQSQEDFKIISGTKGQVWSLYEYDGTLFCGHDSGTFIIENETAKNIFPMSGTWKFKTVPYHKDLLLQGNYYGISVLAKINNQWVFRNKIAGFNYSARYFEITNALEVYVSHEYKGIFRLQLDSKLLKTNPFVKYSSPGKGKNASLIKFNNDIYYAYIEGVFKLNRKTKQFEKDKLMSAVYEKDKYSSGKMIVDDSNKIWLFSKKFIYYFTLSKLSNQLKQNVIPIPASLSDLMLGYENITQLSNSYYLIGTTDGYYIININNLSFKNHDVFITNVSTNRLEESYINRSILEEGKFNHDQNNIIINYTVPVFNTYFNAEYRYLLEGFQDDWSDWTTKTTANFKNLSPGEYVFKVSSKYANSPSNNISVYSFTILKPWYCKNLSLLVYLILLVFLARFIHKTYKNCYHKQKLKLIEENNLLLEIKGLENEQELMRVRNEQLSQDVDTVNRELVVSTMDLNSKNELLTFIKEDLKKTSNDGNRSIKSVISTINKNISEDDSWKVFKEAFDTADKDFLKKLKLAHPILTPNDLRLCAYLRLNLSSKEVAPLLNISVRSVEIKRYRLRKKMELPHEQGLVEYIMAI